MGNVDWIRLAQVRGESSCENDDELRGSRGISWVEEEPLVSSSKTLLHGVSIQLCLLLVTFFIPC